MLALKARRCRVRRERDEWAQPASLSTIASEFSGPGRVRRPARAKIFWHGFYARSRSCPDRPVARRPRRRLVCLGSVEGWARGQSCAGPARHPPPNEARALVEAAVDEMRSRQLRAASASALSPTRAVGRLSTPLDMDRRRLDSRERFEEYAQDALDSLPSNRYRDKACAVDECALVR
jgi:hypothetical protein